MAHAIELSKSESSAIMESASRARRPVRIRPKSWPEHRHIAGRLADDGLKTLEIDVAAVEVEGPVCALTCYCQVDLDLAEGQYFFDSHIISVRHEGPGLRLSLGWPRTIAVLQRRGSARACLAQPSTVQLSRESDGRLSSYEGRLYNLSQNGLAFKISKECAERIELGETWSVCFEIAEQGHMYRMEGIVRRCIPSSARGDVIVGVHFESSGNDAAELARLREFLAQRSRPGAAVGGAL